jgi:hypothetical protein
MTIPKSGGGLASFLSQVACLVAVAIAGLSHADNTPALANTESGRDVRGVLVLERQPVEGVAITLCAAETGVPLVKQLRRVPTWQEHRLLSEDIWFSRSDAAGAFQFDNVPPGRYRLIAQVWTLKECST